MTGNSPPATVAGGVRFMDKALIAYARGPEHPSKVRLLHWLIRHFAGGRLRVGYAPSAYVTIDPTDYIGWAILRTGHYEAASLALALRLVRGSPGLFVDVGANFGWFSRAVAAIPQTRVVAIEPDCANCLALRTNLVGVTNAAIVNAAAGARFNAVSIARRAPRNSGTVAIESNHQTGNLQGDWTIVAPLDELLCRIIASPVRPVLMKIDVEGSESEVLAGLDFTGPFRPRNIIMEYTTYAEATWGGIDGVRAFFDERGYELVDIFGRPLDQPSDIPEANIWARER